MFYPQQQMAQMTYGAGYTCSKSRLNDDTLDYLCFLRRLFRKMNRSQKNKK